MKNSICIPIFIFICILTINVHASLKLLENNYKIVTGDNVNVRDEPNDKGKVIHQLYITKKLQVLKKFGKKDMMGDKSGEWVYIDTRSYKKGTRETIKGWIFDYYLADLDVFEKMKSFKNCSIEGVIGDYLLSYDFNKDGTYKRKLFDYEKKTTRFVKGKLYRYRDVVAAVDEDGRHELFYFRKDGSLCCQQFHEDGSQICATCK